VPTNPRALAGEAALVTGASSGIGAAVAHELSRRGARVALAARRVDRLEAAAQAIRSAGGDAIAIPTDLADSSQVARLARCTIEEFGRIDVLVNNAGYGIMDLSETVTMPQAQRQFDTNFFGVLRMNRAVLPAMKRQGSGLLLHVSSGGGRLAIPGMGMYCASKFAMEALAETYRYELASQGIDSVVI
jgi:NAD(P)-dependent dehydrogenase (short-subunit alcohol dehydrogenase family)